jgi:hypothetical protein
MLFLVLILNIFMFLSISRHLKYKNLDKHSNKKLIVLIYTVLLVAKLSIKILTMARLSFCHYSSDPSGVFTIKSIKNDSNNDLCINQVSF